MNDSGKNSFFLVIFASLMAVATLGAVGFYLCERPVHEHLTLWDSFWWAMVTITTIGYGDIFPQTIGGRLIAIVLMFSGIGTLGVFTAAIAAYFIRGDGFQLLKVSGYKGHVIICGLGQKGVLLTKALRQRNWLVVAIEQNESNEYLSVAREAGAVVLLGDSKEPAMLRRARIETAKHIVALAGDDGTNAEIAAHARDLSGNRNSGVLVCSAHIVDPDLWYLLREWEISQSGPFRLQFFNLIDGASRALLDEFPPFEDVGQKPPHLLLVGSGLIGQSLLVHTARAWRDIAHLYVKEPQADGEFPKLRMTLIDRNIGPISELLHLRHPELEQICDIQALEIDVTEPKFHRGEFLFDEEGQCVITHIYVCVPDDATALSAALSLHGRIRSKDVPIVVTMSSDTGLSSLLRSSGEGVRRFSSVHAVGLLERACQPDLVLGGINEVLAIALHDKYVEDQEARGDTRAKNALLVPWEELPEEARESNRSQAMDIGEKLRSIGCDIVPLTDWDAGQWQFTEEEIEQMARMEHVRWLEERKSQGWSVGPRDPVRKTNPNMVPWEELPQESRAFNRELVREIPNSLLRAGFQVYRSQEEAVKEV